VASALVEQALKRPKRRGQAMQTPDTDAKAEAVRHYLVGKNVVITDHHDMDERSTPDGPRDRVKLEQREWYYRYLLQDKLGATEIRVTFDAMRDADVDTLGHLVMEGRRRKAFGERGTPWIEIVDGRPTLSLEA
jgi:hypothetical protein